MGKAFMHTESVQRNIGDLYQTPFSMTEQLLKNEDFDTQKRILEPACGMGAITRILQENNYDVFEYDLYNYGQICRKNFLFEKDQYEYIITNPPYSLADEFVLKAQEVCTNKFAFLLRTNYLSGQKRYYKKVYDGLETVYIFTRMSDLRYSIRKNGKYPTAGIVYAWLVWNKYYCLGNPQIKWIDNSMYVLRKKEIE